MTGLRALRAMARGLTGLRDLPRQMARDGLLAAIRFYRHHVSPRKGFSCAYRIVTGHGSCSTLGYRAISRYGAWRGIGVLRARMAQCRLKHERYASRGLRPRRAEGGFIDCDLPCDATSCDLPSCDLAPSCDAVPGNVVCGWLDCLDPCDCGDWNSSRKRRRPARERAISVYEPGPDRAPPS